MSVIKYFFKYFNITNIPPKIVPQNNNDLTTYIRCLFHDLRGPLNNIFLGIDVVMNNIPKNSENYHLLITIKESCTFLNDSLDGFLNIKALGNNLIDVIEIKYDPFNIVGLIKKVQHILIFNSIQKNIEVKYTTKKIKEWVIGDSKNIQHVIMNLLSNAIKFSLPNSIIRLELECFNIINKQQHILITIIDNNKFIKKEIKEKLFQKYNTSDNTNGTGLGLYICKKIIELHKGTIKHHYKGENILGSLKFEKNSTSGNIFQIQLFLDICPTSEKDFDFSRSNSKKLLNNTQTNSNEVKENTNNNKFDMVKCIKYNKDDDVSISIPKLLKNSRREAGSKIFPSSFQSKESSLINVMVIDDSELSRKLLMKLIESNCSNIKVYSAVDGLNALLKIVGFKNKIDQHLSMIFVDNVMPHITGELLSKILRGIGYTGLIIGITGNGLEEDKKSFIDNGADYVFVKPFTKDKLNKILEFIKNNGFESKEDSVIIEKEEKLMWEV